MSDETQSQEKGFFRTAPTKRRDLVTGALRNVLLDLLYESEGGEVPIARTLRQVAKVSEIGRTLIRVLDEDAALEPFRRPRKRSFTAPLEDDLEGDDDDLPEGLPSQPWSFAPTPTMATAVPPPMNAETYGAHVINELLQAARVMMAQKDEPKLVELISTLERLEQMPQRDEGLIARVKAQITRRLGEEPEEGAGSSDDMPLETSPGTPSDRPFERIERLQHRLDDAIAALKAEGIAGEEERQ